MPCFWASTKLGYVEIRQSKLPVEKLADTTLVHFNSFGIGNKRIQILVHHPVWKAHAKENRFM